MDSWRRYNYSLPFGVLLCIAVVGEDFIYLLTLSRWTVDNFILLWQIAEVDWSFILTAIELIRNF